MRGRLWRRSNPGLSERRRAALVGELMAALDQSTLLVDGFMCRYLDDRQGLRQLVAVHVPGDFVDLHGFPLKRLDHDVATLTGTTVAIVPHDRLNHLVATQPELARKLWYATLLDAAIHRAWLFRLGRLDAGGRIAHFLCETEARLRAVGLSDGRRFALGITQTDLAEICGLTSIHINRVLRGMREEEIVSFRSSLAVTPILGSDLAAVHAPIDLALANPPYIIDAAGRDYRDGGGLHGTEVALAMARMAVARLAPGGRLILYTGSAILDGEDLLRAALGSVAAARGCSLRYWEIDPDVFGEELSAPAYHDVDRIAVVAAIIERP